MSIRLDTVEIPVARQKLEDVTPAEEQGDD